MAALVVDEFREEEVGLYRCRVDFRTAQTRNTFINVSLIGEEEQAIVFSVDLCPFPLFHVLQLVTHKTFTTIQLIWMFFA